MASEKQYGDWAFPCNITYEDENGKHHTVTRIKVHGYLTSREYDAMWKQFTGQELKGTDVGLDENGNLLKMKK